MTSNDELERQKFHQKLIECLRYDQLTGVFTWLKPSSKYSRVNPGDVAGSLDPIKGYRKLSFCCKRYAEHRLAWFYIHGEWPDTIDHINGIKHDNRLENLRNVSQFINMQNIAKNKTGCPGVAWNEKDKYWYARLNTGSGNQYLGCFKSYEKACEVARSARLKHFGEYLDGNSVIKVGNDIPGKQEG